MVANNGRNGLSMSVNILMMVILGVFRFLISPLLGWGMLINNTIFVLWVVGLVAVNYLLYLNWKKCSVKA